VSEAQAEKKAEADRKTKLRAAYTAATGRLRVEHQNEFNMFYADEAKKRGVDWKPKPTSQEKAEQEIATLLRLNPGLADYIEAEIARVKRSITE